MRLLTAQELAQVLGTSVRTVYRMADELRTLPAIRVGARSLRFDLDECLTALRGQGRERP